MASKQELIEWLKLKPRTAGWGAIVSYDRSKCNALLMEDYINKFTTDSYLPPIDRSVPTGGANWDIFTTGSPMSRKPIDDLVY